jgi:hypothetical protein
MTLLTFMERQLARYEAKGDKVRAAKLRITIRDFRAMVEAEEQSSLFRFQ